jgi:Zn-finger nucleic acid-binding protein
MKSIALREGHVESCPACGGLWIEGEELKRIARVFAENIPEQVKDYEALLRANKSLDISSSELTYGDGVVCPVDGKVTKHFIYAGDSKVILDQCISCGGTWFDGGDLIRIAEYLVPAPHEYATIELTRNANREREAFARDEARVLSMLRTPSGILSALLLFAFKTYENYRKITEEHPL